MSTAQPATTPPQVIAVINAGSSSLKFSLYETSAGPLRLVLRGQIDGLGSAPAFKSKNAAGHVVGERQWAASDALSHEGALAHVMQFVREQLPDATLLGVGHRVVHGGVAHADPVIVTPEVLTALAALTPLAPLHQPHNLTPIRLMAAALPGVPQVACFDTAFHRTNTDVVERFALPQEFHDAGVRRYGFHGLSYEYIASRLPELTQGTGADKVVALHLGNGASACAMTGGRSVATTMGFTALDGLVMGTRCGQIDPGVLIWLMDQRGMDARAIETLLYKKSGLLGVSGLSNDMRVLLASDAPGAALALDLFVHRIVREIGSLAAALGGLDALVFTAGIGENAPEIRRRVVQGCAWLGLHLDDTANAARGPRISAAGSRCSAWVIPTDEEGVIARHTAALLRPR